MAEMEKHNLKKTQMAMLMTDKAEQTKTRVSTSGKVKIRTAAAALSLEKRKIRGQEVPNPLKENPAVDGLMKFAESLVLNSQETQQPKDEFTKVALINGNFKLQAYDPKYDSEEYVKEVIKRDTGHVLSLKTADVIPKLAESKKKKAESIFKQDIDEMKLNRVEIVKYAPHMVDMQKEKQPHESKRQRDIAELTTRLGLVDQVKRELSRDKAKQYIDGKVQKSADDLVLKLKMNVILQEARKMEELFEDDGHLKASRLEDLQDADESAEKPKAIAAEDEFEHDASTVAAVAVRKHDNAQAHETQTPDNLDDLKPKSILKKPPPIESEEKAPQKTSVRATPKTTSPPPIISQSNQSAPEEIPDELQNDIFGLNPDHNIEGDDEAVATAEAARIDTEYDKERIKALIANDGWA